jgi:hypothetical protein
MALTLVKETGEGLEDANSYASAADGDAYHEGHLYASAWTAATAGKKEAALVMATRLIDAHFRFLGSRVSEAQALAWPREGCPNPELRRYLLPSSAVPTALVQATAETARALIVEDRTANPLGEGLKFTGLADLQQSFDKNDRQPVIPRVAQALLHGLGYYLERSASVPLVRS